VASLTVCGGYDSPLGSLVKELKYHGITEQAHTIAQLMWYACDLPSVEALSYVPMHPRKQNQREYNQTELLAQELARFLKLPVVQYLEKNKHTEALAHTLTKADRLTTIGNSFSIKKNQNPPPYTSILVVDDVITTGATLSTVTALLHELKTDLEIHCLAVAHRS
jgi:ComF family protein